MVHSKKSSYPSLQHPEGKIITMNGIRYAAEDQARTAHATLPNGAKITVYPEVHLETLRFLKNCLLLEQKKVAKPSGQRGSPSLLLPHDCCLMKVRIGSASIRVLLETRPPIPKFVCDKARRKKGLNDLLLEMLYVSYRNEFYAWRSCESEPLIEAIKRCLKPEIYKVVYSP